MPDENPPSTKDDIAGLQPSQAEGDEETVEESIKEHEKKHDQNS